MLHMSSIRHYDDVICPQVCFFAKGYHSKEKQTENDRVAPPPHPSRSLAKIVTNSHRKHLAVNMIGYVFLSFFATYNRLKYI